MAHPQLLGPLTFVNSQQSITVSTVSGYIKITWPMPDNATNVSNFFTVLHSQGVTAGKTLANYLDLRTQPQATQPQAVNLPATVNPLGLLVGSVLRNNTLLVIIKSAGLGIGTLGLSWLTTLRQLVPPEVNMLVGQA